MFTFTTTTNPRPYTPTDQAEDLFENYLTREKLKRITGADELENVEFLELKVDSRKTGLGEIGINLLGLQQLKLNNSYIPMVRELGTGYTNLTVLWMARCNLEDLDGIGSFTQLKELYLAYNRINEISDLGRLEFLQVLDLESLCGNLQNLTTEGNPIQFQDLSPHSPDFESSARTQILAILPDLKILDDIPVEANNCKKPNSAIHRPSTSYGRRSKTPINALKPEPARPTSSLGERNPMVDASSSLTQGVPLAGNPILMLRKKKSSHKPDVLVLDPIPVVLETPAPPTTKREGKTPRKIRVSEPDKLLQSLYLNDAKPVKMETNMAVVNQM
ncbi:Leucine-rich repeat-containing protein 56 [Terramyces sp. JEL0728]|nr:Leucine-rich repeat-containing protein 56 [Terramyces sp. JEL0728]